MRNTCIFCIMLTTLLGYTTRSLAGDQEDVYRNILKEKAPSIVTVYLTLTVSMDFMGRPTKREQNIEVQGVVLDSRGLIMISSTALDAGSEQLPKGISMKTIPSDFKVVFENDNKEHRAIMVSKDTELNMVYLIIEDLKGKKLQAMDFSNTATVEIGQELVGVSRYGKGFKYAPYFGLARITGSVVHPLSCWSVAGDFNKSGLPLFDKQGHLAGILALLKGSSGADSFDTGGRGFSLMVGARGGGEKDVFLIPAERVRTDLPKVLELSMKALEKDKEKTAIEEEG